MTDSSKSGKYDPAGEHFEPDWPVTEDLHLHTTASDGNLSPEQLIDLVSEAGLKVIAVTDHDNVSGIDRATKAAESEELPHITVIPGIEFSTRSEYSEIHLIGLFIDHNSDILRKMVERNAADRLIGVRKTVEHLRTLGIHLDWDKVASHAKGTIGRPHIARAMIDAGYVESMREAFVKYLAEGKPGYLERKVLSPTEGLKFIHEVGGVAIMFAL